MEMQFKITEIAPLQGNFPPDITVRIAVEMGLQPHDSGNDGKTDASSEMENTPEQDQLFGRLAALRRQIASEAGCPPYIIFHDSTLTEMCRLLPKNMQEMKTVQGVGEAKLAKYGQRFLDAIREHSLPGQQS